MSARHLAPLGLALAAILALAVLPARAEDEAVWDRYFSAGTAADATPDLEGVADESPVDWGRWAAINGALAVLALVVLWAARRGKLGTWLRRRRPRLEQEPDLRVVAARALGTGQTIHLVEGEGFRLLVGTWSGGMVSLGHVPGGAGRREGGEVGEGAGSPGAGSPGAGLPDAARGVEDAAAFPFPLGRVDGAVRVAEERVAAAAQPPVAAAEEERRRRQQESLADSVVRELRRVRGGMGLVALALGAAACALVLPDVAAAADQLGATAGGLLAVTDDPAWMEKALGALGVLTILALAPSLLITLTSFTRLIIVFSFLRQAMGTQNTPPNQVLIGLALFLTFFVMSPVLTEMKTVAVDPYLAGDMEFEVALDAASAPLRDFMFRQTRMKDLELLVQYHQGPRPASRADVPMVVLIPAFMLSELRTGFEIGFLLYIPFLIVDLIISTILLAMGMMVLPPIVISLPFKILLFVLVDGWNMLVGSLLQGFS